ncbi:hypothetical protein ABNC10_22180, partial [Paenibacillus larvae]
MLEWEKVAGWVEKPKGRHSVFRHGTLFAVDFDHIVFFSNDWSLLLGIDFIFFVHSGVMDKLAVYRFVQLVLVCGKLERSKLKLVK